MLLCFLPKCNRLLVHCSRIVCQHRRMSHIVAALRTWGPGHREELLVTVWQRLWWRWRRGGGGVVLEVLDWNAFWLISFSWKSLIKCSLASGSIEEVCLETMVSVARLCLLQNFSGEVCTPLEQSKAAPSKLELCSFDGYNLEYTTSNTKMSRLKKVRKTVDRM